MVHVSFSGRCSETCSQQDTANTIVQCLRTCGSLQCWLGLIGGWERLFWR